VPAHESKWSGAGSGFIVTGWGKQEFVRVQPLASSGGFVLFDTEGGAPSVGLARLAPKVLRDSAELLARSVTYSFASFELQLGGASAGINAKPDNRDDAVTKFIDDVRPMVDDGTLVLHPGNGLSDVDLATLGVPPTDPSLVASGALAAAEAVVGSISGTAVAVVGGGPVADAARRIAAERGANIDVGGGLDAPVEVVLIAGKVGAVDHEAAAAVTARVVVPLTNLPVTSKAYSALRRADIVYAPDFVALAAPLLAAHDPITGADPVERVRALMQSLAGAGPDALLVAAGRAEAFLATWQEPLPFGRPLA
jgi:glutamate dehydrogenase/leucine dehydrogenase